jgi:hypothetical protein
VNNAIAKVLKATHAYWEIEEYDPNSDEIVYDQIISAGPGPRITNPSTGKSTHYLDVWVHDPNDPNSADTPANAAWRWDTGWSSSNCAGTSAMEAYGNYWNKNYNDNPTSGIQYSWSGPNSNSVAALFGQYGGFNPPAPPGSYGWNYWLH